MRHTEEYVSDLLDTLNKIALTVGCSVQDPDALIRRTKYVAAAARSAFASIDEESIRRTFERQRCKDAGVTGRAFPRLPDGEYTSSLLQYAWDSFRETVQRALLMLGDVLLPEERAVQCMLEMCIALDLHPVPYDEATTPYEMLTAIVHELSK